VERGGADEGAVCFFVEAVGNGFDGVGEEIVVIGDGEGPIWPLQLRAALT